jgi:hypothetical protein
MKRKTLMPLLFLLLGIVIGFIGCRVFDGIRKQNVSEVTLSENIPGEKREPAPYSNDIYFVKESDFILKIKKDVFIQDSQGNASQYKDDGIVRGKMVAKDIGKIDTSSMQSPITNPIWSQDGEKIAFTTDAYDQGKRIKIYTINKDGSEQHVVGEYISIVNYPISLVLVGYSTISQTISFYEFGGLPSPIEDSFSILSIPTGKFERHQQIPLSSVGLHIISSENGQRFLITDKTHLYLYDRISRVNKTLFSAPAADEKAYKESIRGDGAYSHNSPSVTFGEGNIPKYFTNEKDVEFYYAFSQKFLYKPEHETIARPE